MKPARFTYRRMDDLVQLTAALAELGGDGQIIAGGQSLMPMLNMRLAQPAVLLDINRIEQLSGWRSTAEYIELGALVRHRTYEDDADLRRHLPLLAHAVSNIAHPAVRNRGTIGGSLALADPAAELPALCVCLGARIGLMSVRGERWCEADDFFIGPLETATQLDEAIFAVRFPHHAPDERFSFHEIARRHGDYAAAGVAARGRLENGRLTQLSLSLFGISDRPERAIATAAAIVEGWPEIAVDDIAALVASECDIRGSVTEPAHYKRRVVAVLLRRAISDLVNAGGHERVG